MKVCRKCGAVLRDTDRFCSQCGIRVPSDSAVARQEKIQKKKQQKEVMFRTKPEKGTRYRENFEEGENRSRALHGTVTLLVLMLLAVAGFAAWYFYFGRSGAATSATAKVPGSGNAAIQILSENSAESETQAVPEQPESETAQAVPDQPETEAVPAAADRAETEPAQEAEQESETEPQTEPPVPSAADVIDGAQIQDALASGSTASAAEVYIYDLKNDSEAAVNDCDEALRLSAMITVPILYTAASRIDAGDLSMDTEITYVTTIGGRGEMTTESREGLSFPLSFYLQTMVNYSDNNCINILIDYLGLDSINAVCQEAGYSSVYLERGLVAAGNANGLDNYGSARDITLMVRDLYKGKFESVGEDFMKQYFHISEQDSLPTLIGLAPSLADASLILNQNGHGDTRYIETAVIEDNGAEYILTVMLNGDSGLVYSPAVQNIAEYVGTVMAP